MNILYYVATNAMKKKYNIKIRDNIRLKVVNKYSGLINAVETLMPDYVFYNVSVLNFKQECEKIKEIDAMCFDTKVVACVDKISPSKSKALKLAGAKGCILRTLGVMGIMRYLEHEKVFAGGYEQEKINTLSGIKTVTSKKVMLPFSHIYSQVCTLENEIISMVNCSMYISNGRGMVISEEQYDVVASKTSRGIRLTERSVALAQKSNEKIIEVMGSSLPIMIWASTQTFKESTDSFIANINKYNEQNPESSLDLCVRVNASMILDDVDYAREAIAKIRANGIKIAIVVDIQDYNSHVIEQLESDYIIIKSSEFLNVDARKRAIQVSFVNLCQTLDASVIVEVKNIKEAKEIKDYYGVKYFMGTCFKQNIRTLTPTFKKLPNSVLKEVAIEKEIV